MNPMVFALFQKLIYERSGIALGDNKVALLNARTGKRMRSLGIDSPLAYYRHIMADTTGIELTCLLDSISTNVTGFFREPRHFDLLGTLFSDWQRKDQKRFRMWSAACSTGEEPYSMAMVLAENCMRPDLDVRILATDINTRVLEACRLGIYPKGEVEALPDTRRRFFRRHAADPRHAYAVSDELRNMILFKHLNLMQQPFPMPGPLDVIFCRNVMIYFNESTRRALVTELGRLLKPGGYLFVGHAESMAGQRRQFTSVQPSVYKKA